MRVSESGRYRISEVAELLDVPVHVLRQWEARFPQLKPKRDTAQRRYYTDKDVDIARRIKQLIRRDKLTTEGASRRLNQELYGEGAPRTQQETLELIDTIEARVRAALTRLDRYDTDNRP